MKLPNKKTVFIILAVIFILVVIVLLIIFLRGRHASVPSTPTVTTTTTVPIFMTTDEKKELKISDDLKVQILNRDPQGKIMTYKIIKADDDVVTSGALPSIRPSK